MAYGKIIIRKHAVRRMFTRQISVDEVQLVLKTGETIENYPEDKPYPSKLVLGWCGSRPLHVVVADNHDERISIIITAYEPDPTHWEPDFKRRKQR